MSNHSREGNNSSEDRLYAEMTRMFGSDALNEITSDENTDGNTDQTTRDLLNEASNMIERSRREIEDIDYQARRQRIMRQFEINLPHLDSMTLHELQSNYNTLYLHLKDIYDMLDLRYLFKHLLTLHNDTRETVISNAKRGDTGKLYTDKFNIDIFLLFDSLNDLQNNQYQKRIYNLLKNLHNELKKWKSINDLKHLNNTALQITRDYNSELEESIKKHFDKIKTKITQKNYNKTPNFNETPQFLKFLDTVIEKIDDVNTFPKRITVPGDMDPYITGQSTPIPRNTRVIIDIRKNLTELYFILNDILSNVYQHLFLENGLVGSVENLNEMFTKNNLSLDNLSFVNLIIPLYLLTNGGMASGAQCEVCGRHFASRHAMFRSACRRRCMKKGKDRMEILSKNTTFLLDKISFIKENIDKMIDMLYSEKQQFYATQPPSLTDFDKPPRMVNPSVPIMVKVERPVSSSSDQSSIDGSSLKSDELLNILKGLDGVDGKLVMDELKKDTKEIIPTKKNKKTKKEKYIKLLPSKVQALEIKDLYAPPPGSFHHNRTYVTVFLHNYETNNKQPVEGYIFKNLGNNNYEVAISQTNLDIYTDINFEDINQASTKNKIRRNKNYPHFDENNEWNIFSNIRNTLDNYQSRQRRTKTGSVRDKGRMDLKDVHKELSLKAGDKISFTSNQKWWIDPYDKDNFSLEINPNYPLVIGTVAQDVD